jgi:hypothetical protein
MRKCSDCGEEKPLTKFHKNKTVRGKVYYRACCKDCQSIRRSIKYKEKPKCKYPYCSNTVFARRMCRKHWKLWRKDGTPVYKQGCVTILYDPLPIEDGGFEKGAIFNLFETKIMLRKAYFTPGTKLIVGSETHIIKKNGKGQKLFRIEV